MRSLWLLPTEGCFFSFNYIWVGTRGRQPTSIFVYWVLSPALFLFVQVLGLVLQAAREISMCPMMTAFISPRLLMVGQLNKMADCKWEIRLSGWVVRLLFLHSHSQTLWSFWSAWTESTKIDNLWLVCTVGSFSIVSQSDLGTLKNRPWITNFLLAPDHDSWSRSRGFQVSGN